MATSFDLGGLLGSAFGGDEYGDLLTPAQQSAIQQRALLSAASALLQAGAPSTTRTSLGQALGAALTAGQTGAERAQQSALTGMLTRQKLEEARREQERDQQFRNALLGMSAVTSPALTAEQALALPGMAAGPTVERAALVGQPAPAGVAAQGASQLTPQQVSLLSTLPRKEAAAEILKMTKPQEVEVVGSPYKVGNRTFQQTKRGVPIEIPSEVAPELTPEVVGSPYKVGTRTFQQTKAGKPIEIPTEVAPDATPVGPPFIARDTSGKTVWAQQYTDGAPRVIQEIGAPRKMQEVSRGGVKTFVDVNEIAPGTNFPVTLAPQVVGGAESGFFVVGGGGGGAASPRALAAGAPAAAAPVATPSAPAARTPAAGAAATAPAGAPTPAPAPAGMVPLIPGTGPKPTEDQSKSAGFAYRMNLANQTFNQPIIDPATQQPLIDPSGRPLTLESVYGVPSRTQAILRAIPSAGVTTGIANYLESEGRQQYRQAQMNWVRANLRAESGAVIGEKEMDDEIIKYFPQVDDKPATIRQKAEARRASELAMQVRAGPSYGNIQRAAAATATQPKVGRLERDPRTGNLRYVED
jgi:hypothetical protein